jgi:hypothetical protein
MTEEKSNGSLESLLCDQMSAKEFRVYAESFSQGKNVDFMMEMIAFQSQVNTFVKYVSLLLISLPNFFLISRQIMEVYVNKGSLFLHDSEVGYFVYLIIFCRLALFRHYLIFVDYSFAFVRSHSLARTARAREIRALYSFRATPVTETIAASSLPECCQFCVRRASGSGTRGVSPVTGPVEWL